MKAKIIIQELWRRQIEWDEVLPGDILQQWEVWKDGLKTSQPIAVRRWYGVHREECQTVQLHVFCDASEIAYGAVALLPCSYSWTCHCKLCYKQDKISTDQDLDNTSLGATGGGHSH